MSCPYITALLFLELEISVTNQSRIVNDLSELIMVCLILLLLTFVTVVMKP